MESSVRLILLSLTFFRFIIFHPICRLEISKELWVFSLCFGPTSVFGELLPCGELLGLSDVYVV